MPTFTGGHFFKSKISGKIFGTNCSPHIAKKPRESPGEGVHPRGSGGIAGGYTRHVNEKAPGVCGNSLRRHVLAPLIHGN